MTRAGCPHRVSRIADAQDLPGRRNGTLEVLPVSPAEAAARRNAGGVLRFGVQRGAAYGWAFVGEGRCRVANEESVCATIANWVYDGTIVHIRLAQQAPVTGVITNAGPCGVTVMHDGAMHWYSYAAVLEIVENGGEL